MNQTEQSVQPTQEEQPKPCLLGHQLDKCNLQRAGCGSLFEVLSFIYPPWPIVLEMRARRHEEPEIDAWLERLEVVSRPHAPVNRYQQ